MVEDLLNILRAEKSKEPYTQLQCPVVGNRLYGLTMGCMVIDCSNCILGSNNCSDKERYLETRMKKIKLKMLDL